MSFEVLWLCTEVFSAKFGSVVSFGGTSEQSVQVFSDYQFAKVFSLESFLLYSISLDPSLLSLLLAS